uniref:hypothetical protein n=1 Tax=Acetobacter oryzoeni TaxID=2500548 RepID=UPI0026ADE7A1
MTKPSEPTTAEWRAHVDEQFDAIDRCSRFVHLAVYDAENAANAVDFLKTVKTAFPFRITHILSGEQPSFGAIAL